MDYIYVICQVDKWYYLGKLEKTFIAMPNWFCKM